MGDAPDRDDPDPIGPARARERWRECGLGAAGVCAGCWRSGCRVTREMAEERAAFRAGYVGPPLTDAQVDAAIAGEKLNDDPLLEIQCATEASLRRLGEGPCSGCGVAPLRKGKHLASCPALLACPKFSVAAPGAGDWSSDGDPVTDLRDLAERVTREASERAHPWPPPPLDEFSLRRIGWHVGPPSVPLIARVPLHYEPAPDLKLPRLARFVSSGRRWRAEKLFRACWLAASLAAISAAMVFAAWR